MEFIALLKLYINSQTANCNIVHIIYSPSETILLDEKGKIIKDDDILLEAKYLSDITFSANDYTLNTLLNLLPKKIHIHLLENYVDEFVNTIQSIFENRVSICKECNICKNYRKQKRSLFKNKQNS